MLESWWSRADVSDWPIKQIEQTGSSANTWLEDPATGILWLHKSTVVAVGTGIEQGEDWAEVVAARVGEALGAPCAQARLCRRSGRRGSLSRQVRPNGWALWEGGLRLESVEAPGYVPHRDGEPAIDPDRPGVRRPGHSLENIRLALDGVDVPPGYDGPLLSAFDVFVGYLILDALIANRDRHEQNWAVLDPQLEPTPLQLSPSFDHAGSLGFNVGEHEARRRVAEGSVGTWARRGTAHRFEHLRRPETLVSLAARAVGLGGEQGGTWWRRRLTELELQPILNELLERRIPEMSEVSVTFAGELLQHNLGRLRDAICDDA